MDETYEAIVIGGGISGLATVKNYREAGINVILLEKTSDVGGLWNFRKEEYGVMKCTYINVSKQNYSFSDFPFPDETPEFPHNTVMAAYIHDYVKHFNLDEVIKYNSTVKSLQKEGDQWVIQCVRNTSGTEENITYRCKYVAIATGHHAIPKIPVFTDEDKFRGRIIHSIDYKDPEHNDTIGKRILVIGIGNSAVDVAVDSVVDGKSNKAYISTRSGAYILNNYLFDRPLDHYACRSLFLVPWKVTSTLMEVLTMLTFGSPYRWNIFPKMKALQTQPTVSPTMYYHLRRGNIEFKPNVSSFTQNGVIFEDGSSKDFDVVVKCTGYVIDIPFLPDSIKSKILKQENNEISLFKNVFSPEIGNSLAFIGFVQPASGGILSMSETQARWAAELYKGNCKLPENYVMIADIHKKRFEHQSRYFKSSRHTIQEDPIVYNDEIASMFGAKPTFWKHPKLMWKLMFSTCGSAQYRLEGPGSWIGAQGVVEKVETTAFIHYTALSVLIILGLLVAFFLHLILSFA